MSYRFTSSGIICGEVYVEIKVDGTSEASVWLEDYGTELHYDHIFWHSVGCPLQPYHCNCKRE